MKIDTGLRLVIKSAERAQPHHDQWEEKRERERNAIADFFAAYPVNDHQDGGPAFPTKLDGADANSAPTRHGGMSLRAWLAGQALSGLSHHIIMADDAVANRCVDLADAVIAVLTERKGKA